MRARLIVAALAVLTLIANRVLGVEWPWAVAAALAVFAVGEVSGRLLRPRQAPAAMPASVPTAGRATSGYPLSPRELEVALLIVTGLTSKEVGTKLGIKRGTVDKTIDHIYDKLGIRSRAQLAIWLMDRGLLESSEKAQVNTTSYK
jgi:DNA-binding CsgD family transcriptional regulator